MISQLKSEFKKIFTIRSTYGWVLLALILVGIFAIYGEGFNDASNLLKSKANGPGATLFVAGTINQMANFISVFAAIIALLLITHEYRYNTITYTLTASNSRTKVLFSKVLAVLGFVFVYSVILAALGLGMIYLGLALSGNVLPHQDINYVTYVGKILFFSEAYGLAALALGFLIRNQVGAFASLFIIPGPIEALIGLLLKHNAVYLPFTALQQVIQSPVLPGAIPAHSDNNDLKYLSPLHGAEVFLVYLVVVWLITWYLFLRRDSA